jgi:hypothetical protein
MTSSATQSSITWQSVRDEILAAAGRADGQHEWSFVPPVPSGHAEAVVDALCSGQLWTWDWLSGDRQADLERVKEWARRCSPAWSDFEIDRLLKAIEGRSETRYKGLGKPWRGVNSETFAKAEEELRWLVKDVLVKDRPGIVGGPLKALKTLLMLDLAISLGTGTPFLGYFAVPERVAVWFFSAESGRQAIRRAAQRICAARGVNLKDVRCTWSFALPPLSDPDELEILSCYLRECHGGVALFDPLYLALPSNAADGVANMSSWARSSPG